MHVTLTAKHIIWGGDGGVAADGLPAVLEVSGVYGSLGVVGGYVFPVIGAAVEVFLEARELVLDVVVPLGEWLAVEGVVEELLVPRVEVGRWGAVRPRSAASWVSRSKPS